MKEEPSRACGQQHNSIQGIMCHMKQSHCIYGYGVSMVTWICSYCNCDSYCLLCCAEYAEMVRVSFSHLKGTFRLLIEEKQHACSAVVSVGVGGKGHFSPKNKIQRSVQTKYAVTA